MKKIMTIQEAIYQIENKYHEKYYPNITEFDVFDQLQTCESLAESTPLYQSKKPENKINVNVKWNGNDTYKRNSNFKLTQDKQIVMNKIKELNHTSVPIELAFLLQSFFSDFESKDGHWLYVAQHWNPRAIYRVLIQIIHLQETGRTNIQFPPAYFTKLIKFRKQRRNINK